MKAQEAASGAREALAQIELQLACLRNQPIPGCWVRDLKGNSGYWSPEVFRAFGFEPSEKPPSVSEMFSRVQPHDSRAIWRAVQKCEAGSDSFDLEYKIIGNGGVVRYVRSVGRPVRSPQGSALVGTFTDISDLVRLEGLVRAHQSVRGKGTSICSEKTTTSTAPAVFRAESREGALNSYQWARLRELIEASRGALLSVPQMAAHLRLSVSHFAHAFRRTTGCSPHQYLLERRLEQAREALSKSQALLATVAIDHGFFDQSHFTRQFRKKFGVTPGAFLLQEKAKRSSSE